MTDGRRDNNWGRQGTEKLVLSRMGNLYPTVCVLPIDKVSAIQTKEEQFEREVYGLQWTKKD